MIYIFLGVCVYVIGFVLLFILVAFLTAHDILVEMKVTYALLMCLVWPFTALAIFLLTLPGLVEATFNNLVRYFETKRRN